jgi:hypothetical protein
MNALRRVWRRGRRQEDPIQGYGILLLYMPW